MSSTKFCRFPGKQRLGFHRAAEEPQEHHGHQGGHENGVGQERGPAVVREEGHGLGADFVLGVDVRSRTGGGIPVSSFGGLGEHGEQEKSRAVKRDMTAARWRKRSASAQNAEAGTRDMVLSDSRPRRKSNL